MIFDPQALITALEHRNVRYVVIGGLGAVAQGSPIVTTDLDICYDRSDDENLARLASALSGLGATLRGAPDGLPFQLDSLTLRAGDSFTFLTTAGSLDVVGTPAGSAGYTELRSRAVGVDLYGFTVWAASVEDLIAIKRAAGRQKELNALPHLEALKDELDHPRE